MRLCLHLCRGVCWPRTLCFWARPYAERHSATGDGAQQWLWCDGQLWCTWQWRPYQVWSQHLRLAWHNRCSRRCLQHCNDFCLAKSCCACLNARQAGHCIAYCTSCAVSCPGNDSQAAFGRRVSKCCPPLLQVHLRAAGCASPTAPGPQGCPAAHHCAAQRNCSTLTCQVRLHGACHALLGPLATALPWSCSALHSRTNSITAPRHASLHSKAAAHF